MAMEIAQRDKMEGIHMKNASKLLAAALALAILATASVAALAEYGSGAANGGTYTTEQMLTSAIQDEYMALAEYQAVIEKFGASRPFTSLITAEQRHIDLLKPLFAAYGVAVPEDDAGGRVTAPETLAEAYKAGIKAEAAGIAMYDAFLSQSVPEDMKAVFTSLKAASENHLSSFERKSTGQTGNGQGSRNGRGNGNGKGNANGRGSGNTNGRGRGNANNRGCGANCNYRNSANCNYVNSANCANCPAA